MGINRLNEVFAGRKPLTSLTGKSIAGSADEMYGFLKMIESGTGLDRLGRLPPLSTWLGFYRNHRQFLREIESAVTGGDIPLLEVVRDEAREMSRMPEAERVQLVQEMREDVEALDIINGVIGAAREFDAEMDAELLGEDQSDEEVKRMLKAPAGQFFLRVWMPCLILYREYPTRLYRRARLGDLGALVDIIRLDKSVVADPKIAEQIYRYGHSSKRTAAQRIGRAMHEWPKALSRKRLKYRLASLMKALMAPVDPLGNPALQRIYDGVADATSHGKRQIDTDLPADPETFARRMRGDKGNWSAIVHPDKD